MQHVTRLSKLMRLSHEIQRKRKWNSSKSLQSAWAITLNEDITVYHLVRRYSQGRNHHEVKTTNLGLF